MTAHIPVLLAETLAGLALAPNATCVDGTLGGAGHAEAMLTATAPAGRLLGLDADPEAVARAGTRLAHFGSRAVLVQGSFRNLGAIAAAHGFSSLSAVLLDLGLSSFQLEEAGRGFSFQADGPLDMRMDPTQDLTAAEIINQWPPEELANIIYRFGEEPRSRRIARAIVAARPLHTTTELAAVISRAIGRSRERGHLHPATRTFQALRIAVNDELGALEEVLPQIVALLAPGGRFAGIAFHSLEDRIMKQFIQRESRDCICPPGAPGTPYDPPLCHCGHQATLAAVSRRPIQPGAEEIRLNPRSRSAKLRIAERLPWQ